MLQGGTALLHGVRLALYCAQAVCDLYECAVVGLLQFPVYTCLVSNAARAELCHMHIMSCC